MSGTCGAAADGPEANGTTPPISAGGVIFGTCALAEGCTNPPTAAGGIIFGTSWAVADGCTNPPVDAGSVIFCTCGAAASGPPLAGCTDPPGSICIDPSRSTGVVLFNIWYVAGGPPKFCCAVAAEVAGTELLCFPNTEGLDPPSTCMLDPTKAGLGAYVC